MKNLVLLHGAMGSRDEFNSLLPMLSARYVYHTLNFSGHGGEAFKAKAGIAEYATELNQWLEQQQLHDVAVFGYSMGGYVALYASANGNKRISSIVCLGTKFLWNAEEVQKQIPTLEPAFLLDKAPQYVEQLKQIHGEKNWQPLLAQTAAMMRELGAGARLTDALLHNISIPVTLAVGGKDRMVTREETADTAAKIPGAKMVLLENTPHPIDRAEPGKIAALLV